MGADGQRWTEMDRDGKVGGDRKRWTEMERDGQRSQMVIDSQRRPETAKITGDDQR